MIRNRFLGVKVSNLNFEENEAQSRIWVLEFSSNLGKVKIDSDWLKKASKPGLIHRDLSRFSVFIDEQIFGKFNRQDHPFHDASHHQSEYKQSLPYLFDAFSPGQWGWIFGAMLWNIENSFFNRLLSIVFKSANWILCLSTYSPRLIGIPTIIANYLEILFGNMLGNSSDKLFSI